MRVVITGGGTGGHIYPALAVARGIREKNNEAEILFVGTARGMEADIIPREGYSFRTVTVEGLTRKVSLRAVLTLLKTGRGLWESFRILKEFRPDIVIGTGGYVCGPVVMAAVLLKIPTLIHEQNAYPGVTNKLLARMADKVAVTFHESIKYFTPKADIEVTGLPIRPEILTSNREKSRVAMGLKDDRFTVLVVGGSRGARNINRAMTGVIARACGNADIHLIHMTGETGYRETVSSLEARSINPGSCGNINVTPYIYNMEEVLAAADLMVCRAGATTIAEITARGLPAVLVPYPYASENHQEYNARALEKNGAAVMVLDRELTGDRLWDLLTNLSKDRAGLEKMASRSLQMGRPEALNHILQIVDGLIR
ncbi:MAG: undecaprenyldiphospho-muramoylpentapeptide beta-N-acetylglucosaminyltransferase [Firmicutes bacterium HGW-Firmicutes-14]|nr:MAG: undecaprenyldiphospho-muramoylpentapeptide beta-N-acetylglucosaminyltransferase [Firmicutes bacterium HGW-Firmicutes-14]